MHIIRKLRQSQIYFEKNKENEQHHEAPTGCFEMLLVERLKNSSVS